MQAVIEAVKGENAQLRQAIMKMQASDASKGWEHTVGPGDTLAGVAKKYGARVKDIIEANELKDPDTIRSGQKLFIPRPAR
jgi:LysM repeat protein